MRRFGLGLALFLGHANYESVLVLLGLALFFPRAANACGSIPTPYVTLGESSPQDGASAVPRDAPLLLTGTAWPSISDSITGNTLVQISQVEVRRTDGTLLAGKLSEFFSKAVWIPDTPFASETTYSVKVHLENSMEKPDNASGAIDRQFSFTTGSSLLTPLRLTGEPSYLFTSREFPFCPTEQVNDCGTCLMPEARMYEVVEVTPPAIEGGVPGEVVVMAWLDNGSGIPEGTVHLGGSLLPGDSSGRIQILIPPESAPYECCLHVEAQDALGSTVKTQTQCFSAPLSETTGESDGNAASSAEQGSEGCNAARTSGAVGGWWALAPAALLLRKKG